MRGWLPLILLPAAVVVAAPNAWPRWLVMWLTAGAIYGGCKWLTWRRADLEGVPWWWQLAYLLLWPGMDANAILLSKSVGPADRPAVAEWIAATEAVFAGAAVFWGATIYLPTEFELLQGWLGMVGLALMLHFGTFQLLSCAWRAAGRVAPPLMNAPFRSDSVSEFWGRRWNIAFRDLAHRFLFRPLGRRLGPRGALIVGFVASGLIHDLVISVPARGGYGGPTLYFLMQAGAVVFERGPVGTRLGLGRGWAGWLFTVVVAPAFLLFHPPFVRNVVVPFMNAVALGVLP